MEKTILGVDSPKRLLRFFAAKNHKFIPLKAGTILDMDIPARATLLDILYSIHLNNEPSGPVPKDGYRRRIQGLAQFGYIMIPIEDLCYWLDMTRMENFQDLMYRYREKRMAQNETVRKEKCECLTNGKARRNCPQCDGTGEVEVLWEMNEQEKKLAEGKTPEEIGL